MVNRISYVELSLSPGFSFHSSVPTPSFNPSVIPCYESNCSLLGWAGRTQKNKRLCPSHLSKVDLGLSCSVTLDKLLSLSGLSIQCGGWTRSCAPSSAAGVWCFSPPGEGTPLLEISFLSRRVTLSSNPLLVFLLLTQGGSTSLYKLVLWYF